MSETTTVWDEVRQWRRTVAFGKRHAADYRHELFAVGIQVMVEGGFVLGLGLWLLSALVKRFDPSLTLPLAGYVALGAASGLLLSVMFTPSLIRVVVVRRTPQPERELRMTRQALIEQGYEPIEISATHFKMDKNVGRHDLAAGPFSVKTDSWLVSVFAERGQITLAGPAGTLALLRDSGNRSGGVRSGVPKFGGRRTISAACDFG
jgi:hypothetical protein